jgi:ketosteroid isomerase-like protein
MTEIAPEIIGRFFNAMQTGAASEAQMMALFANDAVYVEPFTGAPARHVGKAAVREALSAGWSHPLPDMTITVDDVEVDGPTVTARWTCRSPALPGGQGSGVNVFTLKDGLIASLETRLGG